MFFSIRKPIYFVRHLAVKSGDFHAIALSYRIPSGNSVPVRVALGGSRRDDFVVADAWKIVPGEIGPNDVVSLFQRENNGPMSL